MKNEVGGLIDAIVTLIRINEIKIMVLVEVMDRETYNK